jgi:hypothetical protein
MCPNKESRQISENSLAQLRPAKSIWKHPETKAIRIPIRIIPNVLAYARLLDTFNEEEINNIYIISKKELKIEIDKVKKSKQSLITGLERLEKKLDMILKTPLDVLEKNEYN